MEMPRVSKKWTAEERLALIEWIAHDVGCRAFDGRPWLIGHEQFDLMTRISFIASKRAGFCEDNRDALIHGSYQSPPPPPPAPDASYVHSGRRA